VWGQYYGNKIFGTFAQQQSSFELSRQLLHQSYHLHLRSRMTFCTFFAHGSVGPSGTKSNNPRISAPCGMVPWSLKFLVTVFGPLGELLLCGVLYGKFLIHMCGPNAANKKIRPTNCPQHRRADQGQNVCVNCLLPKGKVHLT
jgi:hypothetical protein